MAKRAGPYAKLLNLFLSSVSPRRMFPPAGNIVGKDPFGNNDDFLVLMVLLDAYRICWDVKVAKVLQNDQYFGC